MKRRRLPASVCWLGLSAGVLLAYTQAARGRIALAVVFGVLACGFLFGLVEGNRNR